MGEGVWSWLRWLNVGKLGVGFGGDVEIGNGDVVEEGMEGEWFLGGEEFVVVGEDIVWFEESVDDGGRCGRCGYRDVVD